MIPIVARHFQSLLSGFDIGPGGALIIRSSTGALVARQPNGTEGTFQPTGSRMISDTLKELLRSGAPEGTYFIQPPGDRIRRSYAFHRIPGVPMVVLAGTAEADFLATWRLDRIRTFALMGASLLGIWLLAGLLWQALKAHVRDTIALQTSEERFRAQFELASEGIYTLSTDGRLLEMNEAFARMHGYQKRELEHATLADLALPGMAEQVVERMRQLLSGGAVNFEVEHRHKDGHVIQLEVSANTIHPEGRPTLLAFCRDRTRSKQDEAERRELEERLNRIQALEAQGVLAAGVAHNLNNVLAVIMGTASLHREDTSDPLASSDFRTIDSACRHGRSVINSLLQFAQPSLSSQAPFELRALIGDVRLLLENTTRNSVHLVAQLSEEPLWVHGDAGAVSHALMNLCLNALDALPDGGTLTFRAGPSAPDGVEVSVQDNGTGMAPEVLAHALDPFFTTKDVGKGTGLGLSMTYGVVKAHAGTLHIASQPGQGTTVTLRLPRIPAPEGRAPRSPAPALAAMSVLLVDDDEDVRILMARMLKRAGMGQVKTVPGGEEALATLRAGERPDLVILDQNMPGMNGVQTMEQIRSLDPELPILISSGQPDIERWPDFRRPRVSVISKPFTLDEIQAKLAQFAGVPGPDHPGWTLG
ncbi:MAG: response regulator [Holophaga sp.]|nr:response regulator [Holophaga sp.]